MQEEQDRCRIPAPNDDVSLPIGLKILIEAVFGDTVLDVFLDALKRDWGASVTAETVALKANLMDMTSISVNRIDAILDSEDVRRIYCRKAERDWDDMVNLRQALDKGKKPRKKYYVSNVFVDTYLHYRAPLAFASREATVEHAVRTMTNGCEGIFVLLTSRQMTFLGTLTTYRFRNAVKTLFLDLKHSIDRKSSRCMSPDTIQGLVLILFLVLFVT